ncbi:MAG: aspartyl/asparaginyl beta-hydroxylase domain-containing protein [Parvularculaceae bacterium]
MTVPEPAIGEAEAEERLRRNRSDLVAMLAKADHRFRAGDHRAASAFYKACNRLAAQSGGESDRAEAMSAWLDKRFRDHLLDRLDAGGFDRRSRHPRFQKSLDIMFGEAAREPVYEQFPQVPQLYFYPDLPHVEFTDIGGLQWVMALEAQFPSMRAEALALLEGKADFRPYVRQTAARPQGDVHGLLENPDWSTLFLWENGGAVAEHVALCPKIFGAVMEHVPLCHIGPRAPSVMLSLLRAGAKIPPHTGMINTRFVCHLPLVVPETCGFRVGETRIEWREGRTIAFDDTVQHEAWNDSAKDRLVLIFDIWRPELGETEKAQIRALFDAVDSY